MNTTPSSTGRTVVAVLSAVVWLVQPWHWPAVGAISAFLLFGFLQRLRAGVAHWGELANLVLVMGWLAVVAAVAPIGLRPVIGSVAVALVLVGLLRLGYDGYLRFGSRRREATGGAERRRTPRPPVERAPRPERVLAPKPPPPSTPPAPPERDAADRPDETPEVESGEDESAATLRPSRFSRIR